MSAVFWDTNRALQFLRQNEQVGVQQIFLSVTVVGELTALAYKKQWGITKQNRLQQFIDAAIIIEVSQFLVESYANIDAYSQGKLPGKPLPPGLSARNMGKNDLWIAATALYFDAVLVTNDADFDHLQAIGLKVEKAV
jgi:predicted nucleic acid-binding protein